MATMKNMHKQYVDKLRAAHAKIEADKKQAYKELVSTSRSLSILKDEVQSYVEEIHAIEKELKQIGSAV